MTDLHARLNADERNQNSSYIRPRDAATLILIDHSGKKPRILMGRRHPDMKFLPGLYVFPGGRLETYDKSMPVYGVLDADSERRLMSQVQRPTAVRARGLAAAAIRELYEETGLLIGSKELGCPQAPCEDWKPFQEHGVFPDLGSLSFVARAITPPRRPKRFDTRFFAADARTICGEVPGMVGPDSEFVDLRWLTFAETEAMELPTVTRVVIEELAARLEAGFHARLPVPSYAMRHGRFVRTLLD
ncbi:NUDIX hydrolase [Xanthobacter sp. TB0139]|uniref:NUDIX hydrolase n=1 Tax=Xanthobacter sp. TB0139 TaxID=3459178 RepID=UPI004039D5D7